MPHRQIVRLGHPALRVPAQPLALAQIESAGIQLLIDDMIVAMREAHGVGLAAPQVGEEVQLFVCDPAGGADPGAVRVVINPMLTPQSGELVYDWEGCLSIPGLRGLVPRHPAVRVQGLDRTGKPVDAVIEGFEARIVQHEHDHLNGVVFLDRMRDLRSLSYYEEWQLYMRGEDESAEEPALG
jgi:peptide deformylase